MEQLRAVNVILKWPRFKPAEDDLHKKIPQAVQDKRINSLDKRESSRDDNQDLIILWYQSF